MTELPPIAIRDAVAEDFAFIAAEFLHGLHKVCPYNFIPNALYFPWYTALLEALCLRSRVRVIHVDGYTDSLVGYAITEPHGSTGDIVLHWLHVKGVFRGHGVARALLADAGPKGKTIVCSHYFNAFPKLRNRYHLVFDPSVLQVLHHG
jgi:hypothetical protein